MCLCAKTSSFHAAHTQLSVASADIARKSGAPYTDKNLSRHLTTDKVGDALMNLSDNGGQLILDCSIAHPVTGTRSAHCALQWTDKTLVQ